MHDALAPMPPAAEAPALPVPPSTPCPAPLQALPTQIGSNVTIGPGATIHAATIEDCVVVGMGAVIMDGAKVRGTPNPLPGTETAAGGRPAGRVVRLSRWLGRAGWEAPSTLVCCVTGEAGYRCALALVRSHDPAAPSPPPLPCHPLG